MHFERVRGFSGPFGTREEIGEKGLGENRIFGGMWFMFYGEMIILKLWRFLTVFGAWILLVTRFD